jgi:hypothetical protein
VTFAQSTSKKTTKASSAVTTAEPVATPAYSVSTPKTWKFGLGMERSKFGFSVQVAETGQEYNKGAYLQIQNGSTEDSIDARTSLGVQMTWELHKTSASTVYLAPGFGLHRFKFLDTNVTPNETTTKTALGPSLRLGYSLTTSQGTQIGLDRFEVFNWTNKDLQYTAAISYTLTLTRTF